VDNTTGRRYVIVGNGIAGTGAAEQIRKGDPNASVILLTNEPYTLYNRIALPPFLKQKIALPKVTIKNLAWHQDRGIDLRMETVATSVNAVDHEVHLASGEALPYDKLLVATGGRPNPLPNGWRLKNVFNFQTLDDSLAILAQIERSKSAVVIGGSYIAYELTEAFRMRGLHTTWMMRGPWFLRRLLCDAGGMLVDKIAEHHGVEVVHGCEIKAVEGKDGAISDVKGTNGKTYPADMLGVGLGILRNVDFLAGSGIETKNAALCDEYLQTNDPDVYAAGDSAEYYDPYVGHHSVMGTWDNATNHGKIVGQNMLGARIPYNEVPTYSTTLFHNRIMAFGATTESDPDLEPEMAIDEAAQNYRRLFFKGDLLLGGVIIGARKGFPKLIELIQTKTPIPRSERAPLLALG
jgi:NADPH-dependent 2,4-dienoyl-CoA reductase/sulfur reductase-like enzyme